MTRAQEGDNGVVSDGNDKSQYEQENDLGSGGGEVSDETLDEAWGNAEERAEPNPWAKTSSGDADDVVDDSHED